MSRRPHLPQVLQGPLAARPAAAQTPDWVWYFAWDDDGGAFYRPTPQGWMKATPSVGPAPWRDAPLLNGWASIPESPFQFRLNQGVVEFRGAIKRAGGGVLPSQIITLPEGYRPGREVRIPVAIDLGIAHLSIATSGAAAVSDSMMAGGRVNQAVYLDAVRFPGGD